MHPSLEILELRDTVIIEEQLPLPNRHGELFGLHHRGDRRHNKDDRNA
jgi:hypothetical protein